MTTAMGANVHPSPLTAAGVRGTCETMESQNTPAMIWMIAWRKTMIEFVHAAAHIVPAMVCIAIAYCIMRVWRG